MMSDCIVIDFTKNGERVGKATERLKFDSSGDYLEVRLDAVSSGTVMMYVNEREELEPLVDFSDIDHFINALQYIKSKYQLLNQQD